MCSSQPRKGLAALIGDITPDESIDKKHVPIKINYYFLVRLKEKKSAVELILFDSIIILKNYFLIFVTLFFFFCDI